MLPPCVGVLIVARHCDGGGDAGVLGGSKLGSVDGIVVWRTSGRTRAKSPFTNIVPVIRNEISTDFLTKRNRILILDKIQAKEAKEE